MSVVDNDREYEQLAPLRCRTLPSLPPYSPGFGMVTPRGRPEMALSWVVCACSIFITWRLLEDSFWTQVLKSSMSRSWLGKWETVPAGCSSGLDFSSCGMDIPMESCLLSAHLHSKWSIYMDHLRPSLCYNRVIIFALGSWNLQLNSTFLK